MVPELIAEGRFGRAALRDLVLSRCQLRLHVRVARLLVSHGLSSVDVLEHAREGLLHPNRGLKVLLRRNAAARAETEVRGAEPVPTPGGRDPVGWPSGRADPRIETERRGIPPRLDQQRA